MAWLNKGFQRFSLTSRSAGNERPLADTTSQQFSTAASSEGSRVARSSSPFNFNKSFFTGFRYRAKEPTDDTDRPNIERSLPNITKDVCDNCAKLFNLFNWGPGEVGQCLSELWQVYINQEELNDPSAIDSIQPYLKNFISTFNSFYGERNDYYESSENANTLPPEYLRVSPHFDNSDLDREQVIHPVPAIMKLVDVFLSDEMVPIRSSLFLQFMHFFEIVSRFEMNHHVFINHDTLLLIGKRMFNVFECYLLTICDSSGLAFAEAESMENALISFMEIAQHILDPNYSWKGWLLTWQTSDNRSLIVPDTCETLSDTICLVFSLILHILDSLTNSSPVNDRQYSLLMQCLNVLGGLLKSDSRSITVDLICKLDVLKRVSRILRWPIFLDRNQPAVDSSVLRGEYRLQLLTLHILVTIIMDIKGPPDQESLMCVSDGIVQLIQWVTFCNCCFEADEESYVGINAYPYMGTLVVSIAFDLSLNSTQGDSSPRRRLYAKDIEKECPLATQELDIIFRLFMSYLIKTDANMVENFGTSNLSGNFRVLVILLFETITVVFRNSIREQKFVALEQVGLFFIHSFLKALPMIQMAAEEILYDELGLSSLVNLVLETDITKLSSLGVAEDDKIDDFLRFQPGAFSIFQLNAAFSRRSWELLEMILTKNKNFKLQQDILNSVISFVKTSHPSDANFTRSLKLLTSSLIHNRNFSIEPFISHDILSSFSQWIDDEKHIDNDDLRYTFLDSFLLNQMDASLYALSVPSLIQQIGDASLTSENYAWYIKHTCNLIKFIPRAIDSCDLLLRTVVIGICDGQLDSEIYCEALVMLVCEIQRTLFDSNENDRILQQLSKRENISDVLATLPKVNGVNIAIEQKRCIFIRLLIMLTLMSSGSNDIKACIHSLDGYLIIAKTIRDLEAPIHSTVIDVLCGMMIDLDTWRPSMHIDILRNPYPVGLLLSLYEILTLQQSKTILERILLLLVSHRASYRILLSALPDLTLKIYDMVVLLRGKMKAEELEILLSYLMEYSCPPERLHLLLRDWLSEENFMAATSILNKTLKLTSTDKDSYVAFCGDGSGFILSPLSMFYGKCLSVDISLRISSLDEEAVKHRSFNVYNSKRSLRTSLSLAGKRSQNNSSASLESSLVTYCPRLFCFHGANGSSRFEAFFQDGSLCIKLKSNEIFMDFNTGFTPEQKQWYRITLHFDGNSQKLGYMSLFINGTFYNKWKSDYPHSPQAYDYCTVGTASIRKSSSELLLDNSLAADIEYFAILQNTLIDETSEICNSVNYSSDSIFLHPSLYQSKPHSKVLNQSFLANKNTFELKHGVICRRQPLRETLLTAGGILAPIYLLWSKRSHTVLHLDIIISMLSRTPRYCDLFLEEKGLDHLMHVISNLDSQNIDHTFLETLTNLYFILLSHCKKSARSIPINSVSSVWTNFSFWSKLSDDVQISYLNVVNDPEIVDPSDIDPAILLEGLQTFFSYSSDASHSNNLLTREKRDILFQVLLKCDTTKHQNIVEQIFNTLMLSNNYQEKGEIIAFIHSFIQRKKDMIKLTPVLSDESLVAELLESSDDDVRIQFISLYRTEQELSFLFKNIFNSNNTVLTPKLAKYLMDTYFRADSPPFFELLVALLCNIPRIDKSIQSNVLLQLADTIMQCSNVNKLMNYYVWLAEVSSYLIERFTDNETIEKHQIYRLIAVIFYKVSGVHRDAHILYLDLSSTLWSQPESWKGNRIIRQSLTELFSFMMKVDYSSANDITKSNLVALASFLENVLYNHREMIHLARKLNSCKSDAKPKPRIGDIKQESSNSIDSQLSNIETVWQNTDVVKNFVELVNAYGLLFYSASSTNKNDILISNGGVLRITLHILLSSILSENDSILMFAVASLNALLSSSFFSGRSNDSWRFLRLTYDQFLFFIAGAISDALQVHPDDNCTNVLLETLREIAQQLNVAAASFSGPPLICDDKDQLKSLLSSEKWMDAYNTHMRSAVMKFEEECNDIFRIFLAYYSERCIDYFKTLKFLCKLKPDDGYPNNNVQQRCLKAFKCLHEQAIKRQDDDMERSFMWKRVSHFWSSANSRWLSRKASATKWYRGSALSALTINSRLVFNSNFSTHFEASANRDKTAYSTDQFNSPRCSYDPVFQLHSKVHEKRLSIVTLSNFAEEESWDSIIKSAEDGDLAQAQVVFNSACQIVFGTTAQDGHVEISRQHIIIKSSDQMAINGGISEKLYMHYTLDELLNCQPRRYQLQKGAFEILFEDRSSIFVVFSAVSAAKFISKLLRLKPKQLTIPASQNPVAILKSLNITEKWQRRQMSNFEYLLYLNSVAGRTFHDLSQYFVFPWILADYESETLDLRNENCYRDLSKPIGALNPERLRFYLERFNSLSVENIPKFLYGTHYSTPGSTLYYLIRMEPFTSMHIALQNNKFDHADRLFHDISSTWNSCLQNTGDVKELIPEFFFLPEILLNLNEFDLGVSQSGIKVGDVKLPPWAKDAYDFVKIHRQALESNYVSEHLNEWIDLIFGYKQKGEEALKAHNVFYYLTYEGAVNLGRISNEVERMSVASQIQHFGQTPSQLFSKPHPRRMKVEEISNRFMNTFSGSKGFWIPLPQRHPISLMLVEDLCEITKFLMKTPDGNCYSLIVDFSIPTGEVPFSVEHSRQLEFVISDVYAFTNDANFVAFVGIPKNVISIRSTNAPASRLILTGHRDTINCMKFSESGKYLVSGASDALSILWKYTKVSKETFTVSKVRTLFGHTAPICSVAISELNDLVVTASQDGFVLIHHLYKHHTSHYMDVTADVPSLHFCPRSIHLAKNGDVLVISNSTLANSYQTIIHLLSINGHVMATRKLEGTVVGCQTDDMLDNRIIVAYDNTIMLLDRYDLNTIDLKCTPSNILSFVMGREQTTIYMLHEDNSFGLLIF